MDATARTYSEEEIAQEARQRFGFNVLWPAQKTCVARILEAKGERKEDVFCIMPTGGGKSLCYQLPGLLLPGVTVVVSPLLALIQDQMDKLKARGILAVSLAGKRVRAPLLAEEGVGEEALWDALQARAGELKFLYTTPETLRRRAEKVFALTLDRGQPIPLVAIDEAHCVSGWGMDFRPSYRMLGGFIARLEKRQDRPVVAAFTATADDRVVADTIRMLGLRMKLSDCIRQSEAVEDPERPRKPVIKKVRLCRYPREKQDALRAFVLDRLPKENAPRKGIIFCDTKAAVKEVRGLLEGLAGPDLTCIEYYGGADKKDASGALREAMERFRKKGASGVMIATSAFGMGVDIPDVRYVVHYGFPYSMTDYIQQTGRAARDGGGGECLLLADGEDLKRMYGTIEDALLLPYSMPYAAKIRARNLAEFRGLAEHCLRQNEAEENGPYFQKTYQKLRGPGQAVRPAAPGGKRPLRCLVVNCSEDLRKRVWKGDLTFFQAVLADCVYSLWYNGRAEFTLRELACFMTGNPKFVFRGGRAGGSDRKEELKAGVETLRARGLLPIAPKPGSKRDAYRFTAAATEDLPWAFPLQEAALAGNGLCPVSTRLLERLCVRGEEGRRGEVKETREYTVIKFYVLHEMARMKLAPRTAHAIIYSRRPHREERGEPVGLLHPNVYDFFPAGMSPSNRKKKERYIHETVLGILNALFPDGGFQELDFSHLKRSDPRDGYCLRVGDRRVRGVEINAELPL